MYLSCSATGLLAALLFAAMSELYTSHCRSGSDHESHGKGSTKACMLAFLVFIFCAVGLGSSCFAQHDPTSSEDDGGMQEDAI